MNDIAKRIHARIVLVGLPSLCRAGDLDLRARAAIVHLAYDLESGCRFYAALNEFETFFHQIGRDLGNSIIDVREGFERFAGTERLMLFGDVMHFTPKGNRASAEAVARGLHVLARADVATR
jgi:lysophospholipase L1-like esterase